MGGCFWRGGRNWSPPPQKLFLGWLILGQGMFLTYNESNHVMLFFNLKIRPKSFWSPIYFVFHPNSYHSCYKPPTWSFPRPPTNSLPCTHCVQNLCPRPPIPSRSRLLKLNNNSFNHEIKKPSLNWIFKVHFKIPTISCFQI